MYQLTEGLIVHYILNEGPNAGQHRPAIVVRIWRTTDVKGRIALPINGCCQLQVFTDSPVNFNSNDCLRQMFWATSVVNDEIEKRPGTWHRIEDEEDELDEVDDLILAPAPKPENDANELAEPA